MKREALLIFCLGFCFVCRHRPPRHLPGQAHLRPWLVPRPQHGSLRRSRGPPTAQAVGGFSRTQMSHLHSSQKASAFRGRPPKNRSLRQFPIPHKPCSHLHQGPEPQFPHLCQQLFSSNYSSMGYDPPLSVALVLGLVLYCTQGGHSLVASCKPCPAFAVSRRNPRRVQDRLVQLSRASACNRLYCTRCGRYFVFLPTHINPARHFVI